MTHQKQITPFHYDRATANGETPTLGGPTSCVTSSFSQSATDIHIYRVDPAVAVQPKIPILDQEDLFSLIFRIIEF